MQSSDSNDEARVRDVIESWARAIGRGDRAAILAHHSSDFLMFDLPEGIVRGIDEYDEPDLQTEHGSSATTQASRLRGSKILTATFSGWSNCRRNDRTADITTIQLTPLTDQVGERLCPR